jgi:hypothetical protein
MNAREKLRHDWAGRIADYKASGLTKSAWCTANQFTIDQLKYWLYKVKKASSTVPASSTPTPLPGWLPLAVADQDAPLSGCSSLVVRVGQANIELHAGFDPKLLREVVQALGTSC